MERKSSQERRECSLRNEGSRDDHAARYVYILRLVSLNRLYYACAMPLEY